jgi:hypothetical protein
MLQVPMPINLPGGRKFAELRIYQIALAVVGLASLVGGNVTVAVASFALLAFTAVVASRTK